MSGESSSSNGFGSSFDRGGGGGDHHGSTAATTTTFCISHRHCVECCQYCTSHEFSPTQWLKGNGRSRCMNCIEQGGRVCAGPCGEWRSVTQYSRTQWRKGPRGGARCDQCIVPPPPPSATTKKKRKKSSTTALQQRPSLPFGCGIGADDAMTRMMMLSSHHDRDSVESTYYGSDYYCYYCSYCCYDDGRRLPEPMICDYYHHYYYGGDNYFTLTGQQQQQPERHRQEPEGVFYNNNNNNNGVNGGGGGSNDDGSKNNNSIGKDNESLPSSSGRRNGVASPSCVSSMPTPPPLP